LLKNVSCQNGVLTIPMFRGGRDEATGENRIKIGRRKQPHAPSRASKVAGHAHRRAPRVTRVFFARMGWPNPNTRWPDPRGWHVSTVGPTCHVISRAPSWAERSQAELELSREPRDRIQCSWSYVPPDLRLNLGRSSGQNCFDQILAVWNVIWTISDLFSANLIVLDAMVRSDHWDLRPKVMVVNY
jgi:hypothetical protein